MKELADSAGSTESSVVEAGKHPKHMRACLQTGEIPAEITERAIAFQDSAYRALMLL